MKISELIAELEKAKAEHGDIPVYRWDTEWGAESLLSAKFQDEPKNHAEGVKLSGLILS